MHTYTEVRTEGGIPTYVNQRSVESKNLGLEELIGSLFGLYSCLSTGSFVMGRGLSIEVVLSF